MTLYKPQLSLRRLVVTYDGRSAYDETFHSGVNIIRGNNGCGKSTIADFIFFALGGELTAWHEEMRVCDYTFAEVSINGEAVTLRRDISGGASRRPMAVFWGDMEAARMESIAKWEVYPFAASSTKQSFSQILFTALGIPEVKGQLSSRITMHQILRLMYADQITPVTALYKVDSFDSVLVREAVGALLCGVYDGRLYEAQIELAQKKAEFETYNTKLNAIFSVLGGTDQPLNLQGLQNEIAERATERDKLIAQNTVVDTIPSVVPTVGNSDEAIRRQLGSVKQALRIAEDELEQLTYEIVDSEKFIDALVEQIKALDESATVRESLGTMLFEHCPACYAPVQGDIEGVTCQVCKATEIDGGNETHLSRMRQEISMQLTESKSLQKERISRRDELAETIPTLVRRTQELQTQLDRAAGTVQTSREATIAARQQRMGYLDRQIEDLEKRVQLATSIERMRQAKSELAKEVGLLQEEITILEAAEEEKKEMASRAIADGVVEFLHKDLLREERFAQARQVTFDFGGNAIAVDGVSVFAASSLVYLKNSFHLALHHASRELEFFRYPRFTLFDNIEDKGMEPERSHNFQRVLIAESEQADVEHQIIMTTSMIAPELENSSYVVGPFYTPTNKSLKVGTKAPKANPA